MIWRYSGGLFKILRGWRHTCYHFLRFSYTWSSTVTYMHWPALLFRFNIACGAPLLAMRYYLMVVVGEMRLWIRHWEGVIGWFRSSIGWRIVFFFFNRHLMAVCSYHMASGSTTSQLCLGILLLKCVSHYPPVADQFGHASCKWLNMACNACEGGWSEQARKRDWHSLRF